METAKVYRLQDKWIDRIFQRMQEIFGEQWADPTQAPGLKELWAHALHGLTGEQIRYALEFYDASRPTRPPTQIEFFNCASRWQNGQPKTVARQTMDEIHAKLASLGCKMPPKPETAKVYNRETTAKHVMDFTKPRKNGI